MQFHTGSSQSKQTLFAIAGNKDQQTWNQKFISTVQTCFLGHTKYYRWILSSEISECDSILSKASLSKLKHAYFQE